jgi:choline dehydrogenase-like flavoprotein
VRDAVIVGSGAGAGPLALRLSQAGFDVLVLEKGRRYTREQYRHDEVDHAIRPEFFVPSLADDPHVVVDARGCGEAERSTLGWVASCVGGGTAHMGGSFYRFHPDDFRLRSRFGAFEGIADWPYTYDALEPYYAQAEWEVGVSGVAGTNPFEGARSRPYPMPPLERHPIAAAFDEACARGGAHAFPTPRAINSIPYGGRPPCAYCAFCGGYGCAVGARGSVQEALLPRAEQTGRCEIRATSMVCRITQAADGRATGCIYVDERGVEHRVESRIVCVCASAVESARLLLLSASSRSPSGLANGNGLVGRHLQFHAGSFGRGRFRYDRHASLPRAHAGRVLVGSMMDHYFLPSGVAAWPKGGVHRFGVERTFPIGTAQSVARDGPDGWLWGDALKRRLREHFHDYLEVSFEVFQDFVPNDETYMTLDPEIRDKWGLPVARIHLVESDHHGVAGRWLLDRGLETLDRMGADALIPEKAGVLNHVMVQGTCRAGADPATSVLDAFCRAHEVPNLFVVDGSFMPTSGGAPTTLTILANSFRTADFIVSRSRSERW